MIRKDKDQLLVEVKKLRMRVAELEKQEVERNKAEEELKAANQQLKASEQQLKAASQQLRASEEALRLKERRLLKAQHVAKMGFLDWNLKTNEIILSDEIYKHYGLKKGEIKTTPELVSRAVHPDDLAFVQKNLDLAIRGEKKYDIDHRIIRPDGSIIWTHSQAELIRDKKGKPIALLGTSIDITERKKMEKELHESEEKFRILYNNSPDMYVSVSPDDASILQCNDTLMEKTGYSREEIIGFPIFKMYHDDCMSEVKKTFQQFVETGKIEDKELTLKRKNGSKIEVSLNVDAVRDKAGKILHSISSWRDITKRKKIDKQLKKSLKEKEILIKEIYHRVKNNLAVVSGLLNMQSANIKDKEAKAAFQETRDRIFSLSAVHSQLYHSESYSHVNYKEYIKKLVSNIFYTLQMERHVKLHLDLDDITLSIDKAIPCGLMINEIVTNALKHAFPENRKGNLYLIVNSLEDKNCEIIIKDDGIGIPESFNIEKSKTLGLKLIDQMRKQIDANLEIESKKGTEFRVRFSREPEQVIR